MAYDAEKFPKPKNIIGLSKSLPETEMEKLMLTNTPVKDEDLRTLANRRAASAKEEILKSGKVTPDRVFVVEPKSLTPEKNEKLKWSGSDKKTPQGVKAVYLVGKGSMCPLGGDGDVYRRCEGVKAFSNSLMRDRAERGALNPAKDPFIVQQIRRMDKEHPLLCPYYINSRMFVQAEAVGVKMVPSPALRTKADRVIAHPVPPRELAEFCGEICPYRADDACRTEYRCGHPELLPPF